MSVTVILSLTIQPDRADDFEKYLMDILHDTRKRPGFEHISVHRQLDDPAKFVAYEGWTAKEDYEAYLAWRTENGSMATIGSYLAAPPNITYYTNVDE